MDHIKSARKKPEWRRFVGLRDKGWGKEKISMAKVVYAALDVTLPFPTLFRFIVHYLNTYERTGWRNRKVKTWNSLLAEILCPVVDREVSARKMSLGRMVTRRDCRRHTSALALSDEIYG